MNRWRRLIAFMVLCCLALYSGEGLIADAHDGDAQVSAVSMMTAGGGSSNSSTPDGPVHSQHACHCLHAHGAADVVPLGDFDNGLVVASAPVVRLTRMPASARLEPQLRPPING
ncbi:MAG TPA: hypothetical protein DGD08_10005 [Gemmatimonas aurantiaca]|uniref:DUF2946 domain-containing protein n=1 Tax=Gemmatimonas aurantiaca TaxID=173480 RepID=A0A3D4V8S5_9BACT|nr:hypothetical protein [Gemmatimonas aurantiaca]